MTTGTNLRQIADNIARYQMFATATDAQITERATARATELAEGWFEPIDRKFVVSSEVEEITETLRMKRDAAPQWLAEELAKEAARVREIMGDRYTVDRMTRTELNRRYNCHFHGVGTIFVILDTITGAHDVNNVYRFRSTANSQARYMNGIPE